MDLFPPSGWQSKTLRELLPDAVLAKLPPILNGLARGTMGFTEAQKKLSALLEPEEAQLLEKGVVKDYLVYYLISMSQQSPGGEDVKDIGLN
jgi:hypothetical protein